VTGTTARPGVTRHLPGADHDISHTNIRLLGPGRATFTPRYWHSSEGEPHDTANGWAPLETAYNALDRNGDWWRSDLTAPWGLLAGPTVLLPVSGSRRRRLAGTPAPVPSSRG
jgi:hypothetical protein